MKIYGILSFLLLCLLVAPGLCDTETNAECFRLGGKCRLPVCRDPEFFIGRCETNGQKCCAIIASS